MTSEWKTFGSSLVTNSESMMSCNAHLWWVLGVGAWVSSRISLKECGEGVVCERRQTVFNVHVVNVATLNDI